MKKIDKKIADAYFHARVRLISILLLFWFAVSFGMVLFAETLAQFTLTGSHFIILWALKVQLLSLLFYYLLTLTYRTGLIRSMG